MTRYIICCSGKESRWKYHTNTHKHLVKIDGERLIDRTVRLIKKYDTNSEIIIMAFHEEYKVEGTTLKKPLDPIQTHYTQPAIYSSRHFWNKNNKTIILFGDVYFSHYAIAMIARYKKNDILFYGRLKNSKITKCKWGELWGISFHKNHHEDIIKKFENLRDMKNAGEIQKWGGWDLYAMLNNFPLKTRKVTDNFLEINDYTEDFDFPQDYDDWIVAHNKLQKVSPNIKNPKPHFKSNVLEHLIATYAILLNLNMPTYICLAGLYHSLYGTYTFKKQIMYNRKELRYKIGKDAEYLVHLYCTINRYNILHLDRIKDSDKKILLILELANIISIFPFHNNPINLYKKYLLLFENAYHKNLLDKKYYDVYKMHEKIVNNIL